MIITLHDVPNTSRFMKAVETCTGHVFLEQRNQSILNMKNSEAEKALSQNMRVQHDGIRLLIEKEKDACTLFRSLF